MNTSVLQQRLPGLSDAPMAWLVSATVTAAAPHIIRIPVWASVFFFVLCLWRLALTNPAGPGFPRGITGFILRIILGAMVLGGVLASYGTLTGRDAGVALLILLAGMKLAEMQNRRDYFVAIMIGLFLLLTNFFFIQSLLSAFYLAFALALFLGALISANDRRPQVFSMARLHLAGVMLLQAIPLMLLLFVLFPRVSGPLWGMPRDSRAGSTGLDDQMTPGAISELSLSDEVAFRVEFDGALPERRSLYWRGPVLWFTDGVKWVPDTLHAGTPQLRTAGDSLKYTVTLEPTGKTWIYALEQAPVAPAQATYTHDMQLRTRSPVQNRMRYQLASYTDFQLTGASAEELRRALQLPPGRHARSLEMAAQWRSEEKNSAKIVERALVMFNQEPFYYTLTPPLLLNDAVDQFLFDTRQGFCEHYAAAFVILMRGAGIPARVVTGYQGGALNPVGNYLIVRQRDAHAWAEVWLEDRGWVRVDPTGAVAPERVSQNLESALPGTLLDVPLALQDSAIARNLWERMRFTWDAVNNQWNQWVLGYDQNRQSMLLRRLGFEKVEAHNLVVGLTLTVAAVLIIFAVWMFRQRTRGGDPARRIYDRFCRVLARHGLAREPNEGPLAFADRAQQRFATSAAAIGDITRLYTEIRYAGRTDLLAQLRLAVTRFKLAA